MPPLHKYITKHMGNSLQKYGSAIPALWQYGTLIPLVLLHTAAYDAKICNADMHHFKYCSRHYAPQ